MRDPQPQDQAEAHEDPPDSLDELSKIVSFFVYRDFNLLAKFFDSSHYLGLEKRFSRLRILDVSKCFYSIYTHSVSWAVKHKDFAKTYSNLHSFEQQFDRLMQSQNYKETNGILVGPELSRIFAEIIFQRIDVNLIGRARHANRSLIYGTDFEFRRYVDDYFIYANSEDVLDTIEHLLAEEAGAYKLHLNEAKAENFSRPFVTPLSSAKREVHRAMYELKDVIGEVAGASGVEIYRNISRRVRAKTLESRLIIGEHGVGFHNVSGWALSILRSVVFDLVRQATNLPSNDDEKASCIERALASVLELVFYIASLDIRVTTTYAVARILSVVKHPGFKALRDRSDWIEHLILRETIDLLKASHGAFFTRAQRLDAVETFNLLIIGAHYFWKSFTRSADVQKIVRELLAENISYFSYISLKFLMLRDTTRFSADLHTLNLKAISRVRADKARLMIVTESYLLLCDLISAPDLTDAEKRDLWIEVLGGNPSNKKVQFLTTRCSFADWKGLRIDHLINRSRLRPVYE